ncbi:MAG: hypothetical protein ABIJ23_04065 [Candidatus Magasanikbacteria bacterium]
MQEVQENKYHYLVALLMGVVGLLIILIFVSLRTGAENEGGTASTTIINTAPTVDSIVVTGAQTLNQAAYGSDGLATVTVAVQYTDSNSCYDVKTGSGTFLVGIYNDLNAGTTCDAAGELDYHDCYEENSYAGTFTCANDCVGLGDTVGTITCEFPFKHFAEPGTWEVYTSLYDGTAETVSTTASNIHTINTLGAIALNSTLVDFGSLSLGGVSTLDAADTITGVRNSGNQDVALKALTATGMSCSSYGIIPIVNLKIATSTSVAYVNKTVLSDSAVELGYTLSQQTVNGSASTGSLYWGLQIPSTGVAGTCTSSITVVGL